MGKGEPIEREGNGGRRVTYCLIPYELAPKLHDPVRRHFRDDPDVQVVVERRRRERRIEAERRTAGEQPDAERRRIRAETGRRVGERRAALMPVDPPAPLPIRARRFADRIRFVAREEPSTQQAEDLDTARLVTRFQSGDRDAFTTLYTRYFDRVYGYLRSALRDAHEAEDATQQVFIKVFEALPRYERRRQPFRAWLFTTVRNQALDYLRRSSRIDVVEPEEITENGREERGHEPELNALNWLSDQDLLLLTDRLPAVQRQVLVLRFMLDLSDRQIAEVLGRAPSDVRALQYRALKFLRQRLAALGRGPRTGRRSPWRRRTRQAPVLRMRRHSLAP